MLAHHRADALRVIHQGKLVHDMGGHVQNGYAKLALVAHQPLSRGLGQQWAADVSASRVA